MRRHSAAIAAALCVPTSALVAAQAAVPRLPSASPNPPPASLQAPLDPGYGALIAACRTPPPARGRGPGGGARGAPPPQGVRDYTVTEIPGVIGAGRKWAFVWQQAGNNGDGILATDDGSVLLAQNDSSTVVKLDRSGKVSVAFSGTHTGGALSMSSKGDLFIVERGLRMKVEQLAPRRRVLAESFQGEPLDCVGAVINDLTADGRGGVYFTMGGLFYADPKGVVTRYGDNLTTNGVILSRDEQTLYVTNGTTLAAFDVQKDGSLSNQREFVTFTAGGGDGAAIDSQGRLYVTTAAGVEVIGPDRTHLGVIPTPRGVISCAFGGTNKKTLFVLARGAQDADGNEVANAAQVWSIQTIAQGYKGRAK
ncbi:MAG TPA: SMP-30/gluconolactonase/LRE family protein [Vicinamibacterales bacterium]|nr:SMP-30/gluconolactonase/LRE family protein [Vicinamibacterales bacterium]